MILYIAEKPSLGRLIRAALKDIKTNMDKEHKSLVEFCVGHLYELAEPEEYSPEFEKWNINDLPIIPEEFKLTPKQDTKDQLNKLLKTISEMNNDDIIVNCGDPGREGQLLVDQVIEMSGFKGVVMRAWLKDLSPIGLKKSLSNIRPNLEYQNLTNAAKARSWSDWLSGINLTRAYTCNARKVGFQPVLSVGRVQTPTLNLIVERDEAIRKFVPQMYYVCYIKLEKDGIGFLLKESGEKCFNSDDAKDKINNVPGEVELNGVTTKEVKQKAPKLFALADLQIFCNKAFGMGANETLEIAQSLYEKHQALTYPRSDCNYLNENEFSKSLSIKKALSDRASVKLSDGMPGCFNDSKVGEHTAIIPTGNYPGGLSENEKKVYDVVCKRFLAQFAPDFVYSETKVSALVDGVEYKATGKTLIDKGWWNVVDAEKEHFTQSTVLPELKECESLRVVDKEVVTQMTEPPKHFTEGTLISAMSNISRHIEDKKHKSIMNEIGGIGRDSTRTIIIEGLKKRKFVKLEKKNIVSTPGGVNFIKLLIDDVKSPILTAKWERKFSDIENGKLGLDEYMVEFKKWIYSTTNKAVNQDLSVLAGKECPKCSDGYIVKKKGPHGVFSGCNQYPDCKYIETKSRRTKKRRTRKVRSR